MKIFPTDIKPSVSDFRLLANSKTFSSGFNRSAQTVAFAGEMWTASLDFNVLTKEQTAQLIGFLWSLKGSATPFLIGDSAFTLPMGTGNGAPVVAGANQTGTMLNIRGGDANKTMLKAGDYIQIGNELKGVTRDCIVGADTMATIHFEPRLRVIPADGSAIIMKNTQGLFRLQDDKQIPRRSSRKRILTNVSLKLIEVI